MPRPWALAGLEKMKEVSGRHMMSQGERGLERQQGTIILQGLGAENKELGFYCKSVLEKASGTIKFMFQGGFVTVIC